MLTKNKIREHKAHQRQTNIVPAKAGSVHFIGGYLCGDAGLGVPGSDTADLRPLGVTVEPRLPDDPDRAIDHHLDNSTGSNGLIEGHRRERVVLYDQAGEWAFPVTAGTPEVGAEAFLVDDNGVSADPTVNNIIAGWFTRPAPSGGWFVDVSKRGQSAA